VGSQFSCVGRVHGDNETENVSCGETNKLLSIFLGYKVPEIASLAAKVQTARDASTPLPMINFDERDLLRFALDAQFVEVSRDYEARIEPNPPFEWETLIHRAPNPAPLHNGRRGWLSGVFFQDHRPTTHKNHPGTERCLQRKENPTLRKEKGLVPTIREQAK